MHFPLITTVSFFTTGSTGGSPDEQDVTVFQIQNGSFTSNSFISDGTNPAGMRTVQGIPAGSNGYIEWRWSNSNGNNIQVGLVNGASTFTYSRTQLLLNIRFEINSNCGTYQGTTFRDSLGGLQSLNNFFRIRVDGSNGDLISEYSLNGSTWNHLYTAEGIGSGLNLYGAVQTTSTTSGTNVRSIRMQADNGLIE